MVVEIVDGPVGFLSIVKQTTLIHFDLELALVCSYQLAYLDGFVCVWETLSKDCLGCAKFVYHWKYA